MVTVKTPAFAESVTEGDVRWEKGNVWIIFSVSQLLEFHIVKAVRLMLLICLHIKWKAFYLFIAVGDSVAEDEVVCEIETDKV